MTTYIHKLSGQSFKAVKIDTINSDRAGTALSGVLFVIEETGNEKFLTNHQISRLLHIEQNKCTTKGDLS
jgi:hypothetical protein